jgi:hypothetical protein
MVFASAIAGGCGSSTSSSVTKIDATTTTTTPTNDAPSTTTTLEPEAGRGTQFYLYTPVVGDCFDRRTIIDGKAVTGRTNPAADASLGQRDQVIIRLDCEVPHQYEVAHVDTATVSATPPQSGAAFEDLAKRICPEHFASYVGRPYQDSALEVGWFLPTPDQQAQGIEFLGCLVFNPRGKLTDTVRNSDR